MKFVGILSVLEVNDVLGDTDAEVTDIYYDSRAVRPGGVFVAYRGARSDGHDFIVDAVEKGANALIVEDVSCVPDGVSVAVVPDGRRAMALAATRLFDNPSASLRMVGVTGTDGKTTTAWLVKYILTSAGLETALFSTVGVFVGGEERPPKLTTSEAPDLQRDLRRAADGGTDAAVVECSSHGLYFDRITGTEFDVAVFTNLSHDHLDLHGNADSYFATKRRLFDMLKPGGAAVVNIDDEYGRRLIDGLAAKCLTFSGQGQEGDFVFCNLIPGGGLNFDLDGPGGTAAVSLPFAGTYNAYNAVAAIAAAYALGVPWTDGAAALADAPYVPGRFETIEADGLTVVIDYAHAPQAMVNVLEEVRATYPDANVVVVFGCPGERDREKRPVMGGIASRYGDFLVVTNDDPFYEDPAVIADEVVAGIPEGTEFVIELDRAAAIGIGLDEARKREAAAVVILGKGHETVQKIGGREIPYNDRETVLKLLEIGDG
ncbi:MAG: UDP-N-acetylmuramoyl-L-alanyl-D-glutamate--2,6-diaminopimelate ligase [Candidatus Coatesbacteria bacterium]|nr:MAG: UDP-N-acetylmuramoyl-L-alanyl-D-glutamate--2,6-diaminopimelate ligase [Candidatus Coatesbacteria bacterium]